MRRFLPILHLLPLLVLASCAHSAPKDFAADALPSPSTEPPLIAVHIVDENAVVQMDIETYVAGVVAGEIPNDWPAEALKAQAILARTFVLKFITEKDSRYPGADISTDIAEAQAYNANAINERIQRAVQETAGHILLTQDGELPYTWFHSHSGGKTETAANGLDWRSEEPSYIKVTDGYESAAAPENVQHWRATFTTEEFIAACRDTGADVTTCKAVKIGQKGKSGRAVTLLVDGFPVNAARLRISLGSTIMRSTLIAPPVVRDGQIHLTGRGYGHGVGLSQWGAYNLAQLGKSAEEIALHYYNDLQVVKAW